MFLIRSGHDSIKMEKLIYSQNYVVSMVAINALEEAYKRIMKRKQIMEGVSGRVVSVSKALDALLEVREDV